MVRCTIGLVTLIGVWLALPASEQTQLEQEAVQTALDSPVEEVVADRPADAAG